MDGSSERTSEEDERSEGKQLSSSPLQPSPSLNSKVGGGGIPDNNVESRKPRVCPICGGGYDKQRPRYYLPCKGIHGHHEECIYGWLSRRLGCPLCQSHQLIISGWGRQLLPVVPQQMTKQQQGPSLHGRADDIPSLQNMPSSSGEHAPQVQEVAANTGRWAQIHENALECLHRIHFVVCVICCILQS